MRPGRAIPVILFAVLIIDGCTTVKRYHSVLPGLSDSTVAATDLFGYRLSDPGASISGNTLWDLSADAQSQLIKILNTRYPDNGLFREAISYRYPENLYEKSAYDYVTRDLRLIFSVSRSHDYFKGREGGVRLSPADRIEYLKITLEIPEEAPLRFKGWNMYSTEYGTIDIADISFSRTLDLDASSVLTAGKDDNTTELSAGGKYSATREEDQKIKYRYLKLNGRISNRMIEMEEEGTRETDLTGNITADVSLEFGRFPERITIFTGLTDSTGKPAKPENVSVRFLDVDVPAMDNIQDTIYAKLRMDYIYRNVVKKQKTFPEWDDQIRYINGTATKMVPILTAKDYVPRFYSIGILNSGGSRDLLSIRVNEKNTIPLIFSSFKEANDFLEWLYRYSVNGKLEEPIKLGEYSLLIRGEYLLRNEIKNKRLAVFNYYE